MWPGLMETPGAESIRFTSITSVPLTGHNKVIGCRKDVFGNTQEKTQGRYNLVQTVNMTYFQVSL